MKSLYVLLFFCAISNTTFGQRNLKDIPDPDPAVELKTFILPEGFSANLYASDPQLAKPIHMNFDSEGQLWVASSEVYPHIKPGADATDKIIVLKDTTGDGRADKRTVFVDNLLIPTGVAPGDGGVYVANSTDLIHYRDSDGDGVSDTQRVVLSGFGTEDTHHLLHTLRWGPDGALYMNQSIYIHSHVETPSGVKRLLGGGIWRFRPETMELEIFCRGFVNPWGHHFDYWGQSFATDGAYVEGINYVFPGSVFATAPNEPRRLLGLNPGSPKHCGLEILSGEHLPKDWRGTMVANDFRGNRVCRFEVSENGSGYSSDQVTEVIKSNHIAFRPIDVKMGPDGAIYIADWYNPIIQHGEVDFRDERRDHVHGRIWRITADDRRTLTLPEFSGLSTPKLLDHLGSSADWVRLFTKLELKKRDRDTTISDIHKWIDQLDPDSTEYDHLLLEAMWAFQNVLHVDRPLVEKLLQHDDHRIRAAAMRLANVRRDKLENTEEYFRVGVRDENPRVRLEAVRALAESNNLESVSLMASTLDLPMDRFLDFAIWRGLRDNQHIWLPLVQSGEYTFGNKSNQLLFALKSVDNSDVGKTLSTILASRGSVTASSFQIIDAIADNGNSAAVSFAFDWLLTKGLQHDRGAAELSLSNLLKHIRDRNVIPQDAPAIGKQLIQKSLKAALIQATAAWKLTEHYDHVVSIAKKDGPLRLTAIEALASIPGDATQSALLELGQHDSKDLRGPAIRSLTFVDLEDAILLAVKDLQRENSIAFESLPAILTHKQGAGFLSSALSDVSLTSDQAKSAISFVRSTGNEHPDVIAALRKAGSVDTSGWSLTEELKQQLIDEIQATGDPHNGQRIYRRASLQCMKCHGIGGAGGKVGPDLISIGASAPIDYLIESLIVPNAKIKENFHAIQVLDVDGQITSGIVITADENNIVLRTAKDELVTIKKQDIDLQRESRSLMPDGTVDELTRSELVDLVSFLSKLGKTGEFAIGKEKLARKWESLQYSDDSNRILNRTGIDSSTKDNEAFQWLPHYATVQGDIPTFDRPVFKPHTGLNPISFLRTQLDVTQAGEFSITIENSEHILLWINGKPSPLINGKHTVKLPLGSSRIVLGIQHANRKAKSVKVQATTSDQSTAQFQWD